MTDYLHLTAHDPDRDTATLVVGDAFDDDDELEVAIRDVYGDEHTVYLSPAQADKLFVALYEAIEARP